MLAKNYKIFLELQSKKTISTIVNESVMCLHVAYARAPHSLSSLCLCHSFVLFHIRSTLSIRHRESQALLVLCDSECSLRHFFYHTSVVHECQRERMLFSHFVVCYCQNHAPNPPIVSNGGVVFVSLLCFLFCMNEHWTRPKTVLYLFRLNFAVVFFIYSLSFVLFMYVVWCVVGFFSSFYSIFFFMNIFVRFVWYESCHLCWPLIFNVLSITVLASLERTKLSFKCRRFLYACIVSWQLNMDQQINRLKAISI